MAYDDRYPLKDYLNSLNYSKEYLMGDDPGWEKNYSPYVINKCMSHGLLRNHQVPLELPEPYLLWTS